MSTPSSISNKAIREPGLFLSSLQKERHVIPPGGALAIACHPGDGFEVIDPQGLQPVHIAAFDDQGHSCLGRLGLKPSGTGEQIATSLNASGNAMLTKLSSFRIDIEKAETAFLLTNENRPNDSAHFQCQEDVLAVLAAPGMPMNVHSPSPATEIILYVSRHKKSNDQEPPALPEPLADCTEETRIHRATAVSYELKKGDYIQVLDVEGRQCSDFQCFDKERLDMGKESFLNPVTTRSFMGKANPTPGLYAKFYSQEFEPLIEVVQDTCGRHDSFGLACNSKYYEDAGYFGHRNCSDNFNTALQGYPIAKRKSWMAMNLFFNTFFDDSYAFCFDDPWSRPGDFVLMRALKDLVCVSSACPCDIDPANGWNPTEIHLRSYSKRNLFKRAIAFRKTTDAEPEMTKETGFHTSTSSLTRNFDEYNGYWLANDFINYGAINEYWACRERVIMTDLSPLRKYEVTGPDAEYLLNLCVTRNIRKLTAGQVVYTAMCYPSGGMIDDGTVFRLGQDTFRWVGGNDDSGLWLREQAEKRQLRAWVRSSTDQLHNLQVQGRKSVDLLSELIWTAEIQPTLKELAPFRFSIARIDSESGIPLLVSRTGYTGEQGYEIFCHPSDAEYLWKRVWQAGEKYQIAPLGLEALDMLRIESGLIFAGYEFCDQTDPFEAGIGFTVPLKSKEEDFIGKQALIERKANPQRQLTGLVLAGGEPAANGDGVYIGKEMVGTITSGVISPMLEKNIALCRMKITYAEIGTQVEVGKLDGMQKRIPAEVVRYPHFDPTKERVKGNYDESNDG